MGDSKMSINGFQNSVYPNLEGNFSTQQKETLAALAAQIKKADAQEDSKGHLEALCYALEELRAQDNPHQPMSNNDVREILSKQELPVELPELRQIILASEVAQKDFLQGAPLDFGKETHRKAFHLLIDVQQKKFEGLDSLSILDAQNKLYNFYPEINNTKKEDVSRFWAFRLWREGTSAVGGIPGNLIVFGVDWLLQPEGLRSISILELQEHGCIGQNGLILPEKLALLGNATLDPNSTGLLNNSRYIHIKEELQGFSQSFNQIKKVSQERSQSLEQRTEALKIQGQNLSTQVKGLEKFQKEQLKKKEALEKKRASEQKRANVTNTLKAVAGVCTAVNDSIERIHHIKDSAKKNRDNFKQTTRFTQQDLQRHMRPLSSQPVNYLQSFNRSNVAIEQIDTLLGEIQGFIDTRETLIASGMDQAGNLQETLESIQERYLEINKIREKEGQLFEYISLPLNAIGAALSAFPVTAPAGAGVQILGQGVRAIGGHEDRQSGKIENSYAMTGRHYQETGGIIGNDLSSNQQAAHIFKTQKTALQNLKTQKLQEEGKVDEAIKEYQTQIDGKTQEIREKEAEKKTLEKGKKGLEEDLEKAEADLSKKSHFSESGKKALKAEAEQAEAQAKVDKIKALLISKGTEISAAEEEIKSLGNDKKNLQENLEKQQNIRNLVKGQTEYLKKYETILSFFERDNNPDDPTQKALDQYAQVEKLEQAVQVTITNMCTQTSRFFEASDKFFGREDSASVNKHLAVASKTSQFLGSVHKLGEACRILGDLKKDLASSDSDASLDLGKIVKLGAMFANPASSTVIIGMELACLLFQDPEKEQEEAKLFKELCNDLKGLPDQVKKINTQLCQLNQDYKKFSVEHNAKLDLVIELVPQTIEELKTTIGIGIHRQTALQRFGNNCLDMMKFTTDMSKCPSYIKRDIHSRLLKPDIESPQNLIDQISRDIESAFSKLQTKIAHMPNPLFNGLWLSNLEVDEEQDQPELSMVRLMLASTEPAHYTGFLVKQMSLQASDIPGLYQYEELVHIFSNLSSKILLDEAFPNPPRKEIIKYSSLLIQQGRSLREILSFEMIERAFQVYETDRKALIKDLKEKVSTASIQEAELLQDPTFDLKLHYSIHQARGELFSLKSLPLANLLRGRPRLGSLYDQILSRRLWQQCGNEDKNQDFQKQDAFYKMVRHIDYAFKSIGNTGGGDSGLTKDLDARIYQSRKNFLEKIRVKSNEELVPRSLSFKDVLKRKIITDEQRDQIKGNFLEVAFNVAFSIGANIQSYYFDSTIRLWTHAETCNPLHRFVDFDQAVNSDCHIPSALNKSLNPSYPDGFFFSIIHAEIHQSHAGLLGKKFVLLSPFFNKLGLFKHNLKQLGYVDKRPFELNHIPYTPMPTVGDGACALHALLGTVKSSRYYGSYYKKDGRRAFSTKLYEYYYGELENEQAPKNIKNCLQEVLKSHLECVINRRANDPSSNMIFPRSRKELLLSISHSSYEEWAWMSHGEVEKHKKPKIHESKQQEPLSDDSDYSDVDEVIEVEASSSSRKAPSKTQTLLPPFLQFESELKGENLDTIEKLGKIEIDKDLHEWVYLPIFQFVLDIGKSEQSFIKKRIKTMLTGSDSESQKPEWNGFFEKIRKHLSEYGPIDTLSNLQIKTYCGAAVNARLKIKSLEESKYHYVNSVRRKETLLHIAASEGAIDHIRLLFSRGIDINIRDTNGDTALERAVINGHADAALLLMLFADDASVLNVYEILFKNPSQSDQQTVSMYTQFSEAVQALAPGGNRLHLAINLHHLYTQNANPSLLKSVKTAILFLSKTDLRYQKDALGNLPDDMLNQITFPIQLKCKDEYAYLPAQEGTIGREDLEKMPEAFWEVLGIPQERVIGIKIAECWKLLKAAHKKTIETLKQKEATLWALQLNNENFLRKIIEETQSQGAQKPGKRFFEKSPEQSEELIRDNPIYLLDIINTDRKSFLDLLEEGGPKNAILERKESQEKRLAEQEEQLNTFVLSLPVYDQYLQTIIKEEFWFNPQEIHLAALFFDKKVQVVSTQRDRNGFEGIFPSENVFNPQLPGDPIVIYHRGNHFERCIPFSQIEQVPERKKQAALAKSPMDTKEYNNAIQKLVGDYQKFLEAYDENPNKIDGKFKAFKILNKEGSLLSPFNKEYPRLFFPNDLLQKIEEKHSIEELHKVLALSKKGVVQRYYHFALSQDERCYEMRICYRVMEGDEAPQEHSHFVVAEIGVTTVNTFSHLPMSAFLIQAMYTHLSSKPVLPGELSFKILHNVAESVIPIEEPFEGLFNKLKISLEKPEEATEGKKQENQATVKEEVESIEPPLKRVLFNYRPESFFPTENTISLTPGENYALIEKKRFVTRKTLIAEIEKSPAYIKAEQARFLLISLLKLSVNDPYLIKRIKSKTSPNLFSSVVETESETAQLKRDILLSHKEKPSPSRERLDVQIENLRNIEFYARWGTESRKTALLEICSKGESQPFLYDYDDEKNSR